MTIAGRKVDVAKLLHNEIQQCEAQRPVRCPNLGCNNKWIPEFPDRDQLECPSCNTRFCTKCGKTHQGICANRASYKKQLIQFSREYFAFYEYHSGKELKFKFLPCPYCLRFTLLLEGAETVRCSQARCGEEFCIECCCKLGPVLKHGKHYHRPSCQHFVRSLTVSIFTPACADCRGLKRLCPQPSDLDEYLDIPMRERPTSSK